MHVRVAKARIRIAPRGHERVSQCDPEREHTLRTSSIQTLANRIGQLAHRRGIAAQPRSCKIRWWWRLRSFLLLLLSLPSALLSLMPLLSLLLTQQKLALALARKLARRFGDRVAGAAGARALHRYCLLFL